MDVKWEIKCIRLDPDLFELQLKSQDNLPVEAKLGCFAREELLAVRNTVTTSPIATWSYHHHVNNGGLSIGLTAGASESAVLSFGYSYMEFASSFSIHFSSCEAATAALLGAIEAVLE